MKELNIDLLSRPGCHLCDQALEELERLCEEFPIQVTKVDISRDLDLLSRFQNDIPVGLAEGRELFRHIVHPDRLRPLLVRWVEKGLLD